MSESLRSKTIHGVAWSSVDNVIQYGVTFGISILLARLLSPEDYGLIGLTGIFIALSSSIVNAGFTNALIRKKDIKEDDYNTAFITNLSLSFFIYALLFISAPYIAIFFRQSELTSLIRVVSVGIILSGISIVQRARLTKNIDFKSQAKITFLTSIITGIVGISLAILGCGVWALAFSSLTSSFFTTCFLCIANKWFPKLHFSLTSFKDLFGFGWKLMVSGLLATAWQEIYKVVIGKFYNSSILGLYTRAFQFASLFSSNLTNIIQRVSFPVLSSIQDDQPRLKPAYQHIIKTTMFLAFVLMLGMAAVAKPMIYVLIGEKWLPCVPFLQIICFEMMFYPLHAINLNMLQVKGRSDLFLKLEIIKKVIAIIPVLLGIFFSIYWMLIGGVVVSCFSYYLNAYYSGTFVNYKISEQIKDILPSFFIAALMAIPVYLISFIEWSAFLLLPIQIIIGFCILYIICEKISFPEYLEIKSIVLKYRKRRTTK